jgi:hypothetical protein
MRQHYKPEERADAALDFLAAIVVALLLAAPFIIYFWSMKP